VRRHAKASSAGSIFGRSSRSGLVRRAAAVRDASPSADGSGAPSPSRTIGRRAALSSLLVASIFALTASPASAVYRHGFVATEFGSDGTSGTSISGINVLAYQQANKRLYVLSSGKISGFSAPSPGTFTPLGGAFPKSVSGGGGDSDLAVDNSGTGSANNLYETPDGSTVAGFDSLGAVLSGWPVNGGGEICGVAVDNAGNVWFGKYPSGSSAVQYASSGGSPLQTVSMAGGAEQLCKLTIDTSNNDLYASSYGGTGVWQYTAASGYTAKKQITTSVASGTNNRVVVNGAKDVLYVGGPGTGNKVQAFDTTTGSLLETIPTPSSVRGLAVNESNDTLYVATENGKVNEMPGADVAKVTLGATTEKGVGKFTVNGTVNPENMAVTECKIEYGTASSYENSKLCEGAIPTDSADHPVSAKVTGLKSLTTYHFHISAKNANGTGVSVDGSFTTPQTIFATDATNLTGTHATLHGVVFPGSQAVSECKFEYGKNFSFDHSVPCIEAIPTDDAEHLVSAVATHLVPNENFYQFRLSVTNGFGTSPSETKFFVTPETVKTTPASDRTASSVKMNGSINPDGVPLTECYFEYGLNQSYGSTVPCEPSAGSIPADTNTHVVSGEVTGLPASATYHYRVVAVSADGTARGADAIFHTLGPLMEGVKVSFPSITETTATIEATVNPQGQGTAYKVEYVTQEQFDEAGYAGASVAPTGVKGIGHGEDDVTIKQVLSGLAPETQYHARLIVSSLGGTIIGPDMVFGTFPTQSFTTGCPNEKFRKGVALPDCRAYEQASPVDKNGNIVGGGLFHTQASTAGDAVLFESYSGVPTDNISGAEYVPQYVAFREGGNWITKGVLPPPSFGQRLEVYAWTSDLRLGISEGERYGDPFKAGWVAHDLVTDESVEPTPFGFGGPYYDGSSADGSKIFFETYTKQPITGGVEPANFYLNLYKWDRDTGDITVVGVLPAAEGGEAPEEGSFGGGYAWWSGNNLEYGGAVAGQFTQSQHAISDSGDRVFFTSSGPAAIYMREGLNGPSPETVNVSASQRSIPDPNGTKPAAFTWATPDGKIAFFVSCEKLTNDSTAVSTGAYRCDQTTQGQDLYAYDTESGELTDLTVDNGDPRGAEVKGVVGASDDGTRVYFVANGDLDGGGPAATGDCRSSFGTWAGKCSLYLWNEGEISFVAPMNSEGSSYDDENWQSGQANNGYGGQPVGFVSSDGESIVFRSGNQLTSYKNEGTSEFYRYHVGDPGLVCVTCSPTGAPPSGSTVTSINMGAFSTGTQATRLHNLSSDGSKFFFETTAKLVPADTNGDIECNGTPGFNLYGPRCQDVYEWEADGSGACEHPKGCFYLLSTGKEDVPAFFADAGVSGNDVFLFSFAKLVPQDGDTLQDVYDVRVDGGLSSQHPEILPPCEGDACRGEHTATPPVNGAGTAVFEGPENPTPVHKCGKGFVKKRGACVKKKRQHKRHHRHANKTRRASR
jgi:hypothetical protein